MEVTRSVLHILSYNGHMPLASALNVSSICKTLQGMLSGAYWEMILRRHFPSFYLSHLEDYNKRKDVSWRDEYKRAYQSLGLRYLDGANLQQTKVLYFGPTLDEDTIDDINNYHGRFYLPSVGSEWNFQAIYEGNILCGSSSGESLIVTGVAGAAVENGPNNSNSRTDAVFANRLYITKWLKRVRFLMCYDIRTKKKMWQTKVKGFVGQEEDNNPIVPCDNKVFYLSTRELICFDALSGEEMFRIKSVSREKKDPKVEENPRKRLKTEADDKEEEESYTENAVECGDQLAIIGDLAIWTAEETHVVVANWRTQEIHHTFDLRLLEVEDFHLSRFAIGDGVMFVNLFHEYADTEYPETYCVALDIANKKSGITKLWQYQHPEASFETWSEPGPCVYGDLVFDMFWKPARYDGWVVALDAHSGMVIWQLKFDIGEPGSSDVIHPVHLFVIEGTASIAERQKLREKRITDKAAGIKDDDEEAGRVQTKFPTLRFAIHNYGSRSMLVEGGAVAETGKLLYFKEHRDIARPYNPLVAISKHHKPQYLSMSP